MEGFGLVELLSVLGSLLVSMHILLSGPAGGVPEGRVHSISRAIVHQRLPWPIQVGFVGHVLLELDSLFLRKLLVWVPGLEHGAWVLFGADVAGSEGGLVGRVLRVVCWVGQWLGLGAEPPGSRVEGVVRLRDVHLVESVGSQKLVETLYLPSGGHSGNRIVDHFLVQDSTALLSEPLLQV